MLHALKLRSVGRNAGKTASLSGVAGTLFLVSKEMAEEMYGAMECRGFTGEYRARSGLRLRSSDLVLTVATGLLGAAFFWARG
jgi:cobalt/nickel transport system permease protein